jgi:hypothetical protein
MYKTNEFTEIILSISSMLSGGRSSLDGVQW